MPTLAKKKPLIVITGTTASGKTSIATNLALLINGEIISADSRQVYRGMDIGTGKDLEEYTINGITIPYHLIDIKNAGDRYDGFLFQTDFFSCYENISLREKVPILCGGTGMYINLALSKEPLLNVEPNQHLRLELNRLTDEELIIRLKSIEKNLHNTTDILDRDRCIRAIEIATYKNKFKGTLPKNPVEKYIIYATNYDREVIRQRIRKRLDSRLESGLISEVVNLKKQGVSSESLNYYGLEYKFINQYLEKELTYDQMYTGLLQEIRRFAKKQMTWFRRMEKKGFQIDWLDMTKTKIELAQKIATDYETI